MRCDMSDSQFLEFVDLDLPAMRAAADLLRAGRTRAAARAAAAAMFERPLAHPVREAEIPELAAIIRRRFPAQVDWLVRLADHYLLVGKVAPGLVCGSNHEEEQALYRSCGRNWKRRGEAVHALARLSHLAGDRRYRDAAVQAMRQFVKAMPALPDGEHAGAFSWHPHGDVLNSHDPGHAAEKICHALPYLRGSLSAEEALLFAKGLLAMADFDFRTCRHDVCHNITLHMLTGALLVGLCLPALKPARRWVEAIQRRLEDDFCGPAFVSADGYFGEGLGYQNVNHNLMQVCLRYLRAAGRKVSPRLARVCERSFELAAAVTRADGHTPLLGDCHAQMPHELYIQTRDMLHYAAVYFRRPDFKAAAGSPYREDPLEYNVWLMGLEGLAWWDSLPGVERRCRAAGPHDLRASGLQVFGLGRGLEAHSGLLACARAHNHAHADFGHIDVYGLGRPLLTDSSVTSYAENSYRSERAHNTVVPVRRQPLGPRLDRLDHARTLFVVHAPQIQAACMEHDLYESHRIRRTVCLVDAGEVLGPTAGTSGKRRRGDAGTRRRGETAAEGGSGFGVQGSGFGVQGSGKNVRAGGRGATGSLPASAAALSTRHSSLTTQDSGLSTQDCPAFWLVIDRVERAFAYPGRGEPEDYLETYFHFNAPQSRLGRLPGELTCWSRFDPDGLVLLRYSPTDTAFAGKPQRVRLRDFLRAYEDSASDANLQVSAVIPPDGDRRYIMDLRLLEGFTGEYHGRVKRPVAAFRWRGFLPFEAAYVLVPFRGVRDEPYAAVTGQWNGPGDLTVAVQLPQGTVRVRAAGLAAARPRPRITIRGSGASPNRA